jgi:hypothetical protein
MSRKTGIALGILLASTAMMAEETGRTDHRLLWSVVPRERQTTKNDRLSHVGPASGLTGM